MKQLREVTIEITQRCPNFCIHCSSLSHLKAKEELSVSMIKKTIGEAKELGASTINISGGEPFLHPQIIEIVNYIKSLGLSCLLYTSAVYHNGENYTGIPSSILSVLAGKIDKLIVNIESVDPVKYGKIMGTTTECFHLMEKTIEDAVSLGYIVEAHIVPMKINIDEIDNVIHWCNKKGIVKVSFLRLVVQGRAKENKEDILLEKDDIEEIKKRVNYIRDKGYNLRLGIPFSECSKRINCMAGTVKLTVRYDGNVYPCEAFKGDQPKIFRTNRTDNIKEHSLTEIYNSSDYLCNVRRIIKNYQTIKTSEPCVNQYYRNKE